MTAGYPIAACAVRWLWRPVAIALTLTFLASLAGSADRAGAVIVRMYTLPFEGQYSIGQVYWDEHRAIDYTLGTAGAGGHPILAAARGTTWHHEQFPSSGTCVIPNCAGYYIVMDHGSGHRSRYLHLSSRTAGNGQVVERGAVIGYEGNSGTTAYHLHFETRHNGTSGSNCCSGTPFDPYYGWKTVPPSMRGADWNGDGCADVLARWTSDSQLYMYRGNCVGGFTPGGPIQVSTGSWSGVNWMVRPGDFSGDGCPDILARWTSDMELYLYRGNCVGGFIPGGPIKASTGPWSGVSWIDGPGDFSGDGCVDVLGRWTSDTHLYMYRGNCAGGWIAGGPTQVGTNWGWPVSWIEGPGDFSGDGCADVLARWWVSGIPLYMYQGNCAGDFIAGDPSQVSTGSWGGVNFIAGVGDFSGYECPDVLARWTSDSHLYLYRGNCAGGWIPGGPSQISTGSWSGVNWIF
jgi:murein DD-endopeptidase MepM/ murein hydrolase activator NlpD